MEWSPAIKITFQVNKPNVHQETLTQKTFAGNILSSRQVSRKTVSFITVCFQGTDNTWDKVEFPIVVVSMIYWRTMEYSLGLSLALGGWDEIYFLA